MANSYPGASETQGGENSNNFNESFGDDLELDGDGQCYNRSHNRKSSTAASRTSKDGSTVTGNNRNFRSVKEKPNY